MIEILSRRSRSGDLCINLARRYLMANEWGMARLAVQEGLARGRLSEPDQASALMEEICRRLGIQPGQCEQGFITTVMEERQ